MRVQLLKKWGTDWGTIRLKVGYGRKFTVGARRMPLSDVAVRATRPRERAYKVHDRNGLFLLVNPSGSKLWHWRYRFDQKEKTDGVGGVPSCEPCPGPRPSPYIHLYHGNTARLTESLEVIQKTSGVILSALEKPAAEATEEPQTDMAKVSWPRP